MSSNNFQTAINKCIGIHESFYEYGREADTINLSNEYFPDIFIPSSWGGVASSKASEIAHKLMSVFSVDIDATDWFTNSVNTYLTVKASLDLALLKEIHPKLADKIAAISNEQNLNYEVISTVNYITEEQFSLPPCIYAVFQSLCDENVLELTDMELASLLSAGIASLSYSSENKYGAGAPYADDLSRSRLYESVNGQNSDGTDAFLTDFDLVS